MDDSQDNSTARRAREERALADAVEEIGGVEMRPLDSFRSAMCTLGSAYRRTRASSASRWSILHVRMPLPSATVAVLRISYMAA